MVINLIEKEQSKLYDYQQYQRHINDFAEFISYPAYDSESIHLINGLRLELKNENILNHVLIDHVIITNTDLYFVQNKIYAEELAFIEKDNHLPGVNRVGDQFVDMNDSFNILEGITKVLIQTQKKNEMFLRDHLSKLKWHNVVLVSDHIRCHPMQVESFTVLNVSDLRAIVKKQSKQERFVNYISYFKGINKETLKQVTELLIEHHCDLKEAKEKCCSITKKELLGQLMDLRTSLAKKEGKKAYLVFTNKIIEDMVEALPTNDYEFLAISGIGIKRLKLYGEDFISIINKAILKEANEETKIVS